MIQTNGQVWYFFFSLPRNKLSCQSFPIQHLKIFFCLLSLRHSPALAVLFFHMSLFPARYKNCTINPKSGFSSPFYIKNASCPSIVEVSTMFSTTGLPWGQRKERDYFKVLTPTWFHLAPKFIIHSSKCLSSATAITITILWKKVAWDHLGADTHVLHLT